MKLFFFSTLKYRVSVVFLLQLLRYVDVSGEIDIEFYWDRDVIRYIFLFYSYRLIVVI